MSSGELRFCETATGGVFGIETFMTVSSRRAAEVSSALPARSVSWAPGLMRNWSDHALLGVKATAKVLPEIWVTAPIEPEAIPAFPKSTALMVLGSICLLNVTV